MITYEFLQNYWWLLISVLGAVLVFLLFVQGGQSMLATTKDMTQRSMMVNSLGRKWELTFTTLVVFGGAFFASFPLFYSTSFGGAYWLWMLILFSFVVQAVSYKYRRKEGNIYGYKLYDWLLFVNGVVGPLLLGVAVAMMFFGAEFTVTKTNILNPASATISQWGELHGLEAIFCWKNLVLGITVLFLARIIASLYFINNINDTSLNVSQRKSIVSNAVVFVPFFLIFVVVLLMASGVECADNGQMQWVENKYFHNLVDMWWIAVVLLAGVVLVLYGIVKTIIVEGYTKGVWSTGCGTILVVLSLFWIVGYNNTAYYPSLLDVSSSLTIHNSSSSEFTLTAMSVVSILVPFVLAYIVYAWYSLDKIKITKNEIENPNNEDKY
ncbi:MAG: cytochrome d ubiquinol oxidase subunit II [bacterium]|nr:cytochrome d ubiquinol oxidase subunit II [bacterium]